MDRRHDDAQIRRFPHRLAIEHQRFEPVHVERIDLLAERNDRAALRLGDGGKFLGLDRIHLPDDPARVRLHDLGAIAEVDLVAVIVRRIVARGDHDAGVRPLLAHGKGKLGRGARALKEANVAAEAGGDMRGELREIARKVAGIVSHRDLRFLRGAALLQPLGEITDQPLGRARDIEIVHRVRPHAGELRAIERLRRAALGEGHDLADGAPAQPAGAEGERLKKAVIQLAPSRLGDQLLDARPVEERAAAVEKLQEILGRGFQQETLGRGFIDACAQVAHGGNLVIW